MLRIAQGLAVLTLLTIVLMVGLLASPPVVGDGPPNNRRPLSEHGAHVAPPTDRYAGDAAAGGYTLAAAASAAWVDDGVAGGGYGFRHFVLDGSHFGAAFGTFVFSFILQQSVRHIGGGNVRL